MAPTSRDRKLADQPVVVVGHVERVHLLGQAGQLPQHLEDLTNAFGLGKGDELVAHDAAHGLFRKSGEGAQPRADRRRERRLDLRNDVSGQSRDDPAEPVGVCHPADGQQPLAIRGLDELIRDLVGDFP